MRASPAASAERVHWSVLPGRFGLALLLALLAFGALTLPGQARAAVGTVTITSPLYGGVAEGPVGAEVNVQGANWPPNTTVDLNAADVHGDTSGLTGSACANNSVTLFTLGEATSDGGGNFTATFLWSASAGFAGHSFWVCGTADTVTTPGVSSYKVLSGSAPSVAINASQAAAGSNIMVTGQNWLPANQQIQVTIASAITGQPMYSSMATTTPDSNGAISVSVQVPAAPAGTTLYVTAQNLGSNNPGSLHTQPTNTPQFTVAAQPTPTPTATPSPTPTNTPTATSTAANGGSNGGANGSGGSGGSSGDNGLLIILLIALVVVLLAAAGIAVLLFLRSRRPAPGTAGGGGPSYGPPGGYPPSGRSGPPGGYPPQGGYGPPGGYGSQSGPGRASRQQRPDGWGSPGAPGQGGGWGNAGGWQGNPQGPGPDDPDGDEPTVGMPNPWR